MSVCFDKLPTRTSNSMSAWPETLYGCVRGRTWLHTEIDNMQSDTMTLLSH